MEDLLCASASVRPEPSEVEAVVAEALRSAFRSGLSEGRAQLLVRCIHAELAPSKGYADED